MAKKQASATAVDRFLLRALPPADYASVRVFEPCIVVTADGARAFKHAVLTDTALVLVDNPPKALAPLADMDRVVSIEVGWKRTSSRRRRRRRRRRRSMGEGRTKLEREKEEGTE